MGEATVCLTFDFDGIGVWAGMLGPRSTQAAVSRGEFSGHVAVAAAAASSREGVSATSSSPAHARDLAGPVPRILDEGHEIGHHGYHHITPAAIGRPPSASSSSSAGGDGPRPRLLSRRGLPLTRRGPFAQLHTTARRERLPVRVEPERAGLRAVLVPHRRPLDPTGAATFGPGDPRFCRAAGVLVARRLRRPRVCLLARHSSCPRRRARARWSSSWLADMDFAAEEVPGGVFTMTFHPQVIGRGARIRVLERMIAAGKERGVEFRTARAAAEEWITLRPFSSRS